MKSQLLYGTPSLQKKYTVLLSISLSISLSPWDVWLFLHTQDCFQMYESQTPFLQHSNLPFSSGILELELSIIDRLIKQLIVHDIVDSILFILFMFIEKRCPRHFRRCAGFYAHTNKKKIKKIKKKKTVKAVTLQFYSIQ